MKSTIVPCASAAILAASLAATAVAKDEPATSSHSSPAATVAESPSDDTLDLNWEGKGVLVLIRGKEVFGPKRLDGSAQAQEDMEELLRDVKAGEPAVLLVASEIMLVCDASKTRIAATDCKFLAMGKQGTIRGQAATAQIVDSATSLLLLQDAQVCAGLHVPGPDLDKAAKIKAQSIQMDFSAFRLTARGADACLDLSSPRKSTSEATACPANCPTYKPAPEDADDAR